METMNVEYWRSICNQYLSSFDNVAKEIHQNIPRIYIPNEKIELIISWYRDNFELIKDITPIFNEYYLTVDLKNILHISKPSLLNTTKFITIEDYNLAVNIANAFEKFFSYIHLHVTHKNNKVKLAMYSSTNNLIGLFEIPDNKSKDNFYDTELIIKTSKDICNDANTINKVEYYINMAQYIDVDDIFNKLIKSFNTLQIFLFIGVNYYIANYTKTFNIDNKEIYRNLNDECKTIISKDHKDYKDYKFLTRPLYDIGKLDLKIQNSKKSYEHSSPNHAFIVKGHWRHYKSGKKVFINSYIKCEEKGNLIDNIIVKPRKREVI